MEQPEIINKLQHIDLEKLGKKGIHVIVGVLFGTLGIILASKFINDNFTFRINRISNLPEGGGKSTATIMHDDSTRDKPAMQ